MRYAVDVTNVIKIYEHRLDRTKISALQGCDLLIKKGELVSVIGPSGAGKSTLLRIISGIEQPSSGTVQIGGTAIQDWDEERRREFRRKFIGTFSQHVRENLDPRMSVFEVLRWELLNADWMEDQIQARVDEVLAALNLSHLKHSSCGLLSAGEGMRVSLAKSIVKRPYVVLADEPSGQLDTENMHLLHQLMRRATEEGTSIIVATHDVRFQALSDRSLMILDGRLASEEESLDLLLEHQDIDSLKRKGEITRNVILDSTNHVRLPNSLIYGLGIKRMGKFVIDLENERAFLAKHENDEGAVPHTEKRFEPIAFQRSELGDLVISADQVFKHYGNMAQNLEVIHSLNLRVREGEFVVLLGPSGVGKTTLLSLFAGLDSPSSGLLEVCDHQLTKMSDDSIADFRLHEISILTQNYILHPYLSVAENVRLSSFLTGDEMFITSVKELLERLDLGGYWNAYPGELSGGQRQRVAFVSALMKPARLFLLDEPTANLDSILAKKLMNILTIEAMKGKTIVMATHDLTLIRPGYRVLRVADKGIVDDVIADESYCQMLREEFLHST